MLGGFDKNDRSKSVLACLQTKLLQSCSETSSDSVWHRITDVPVYHSTCAAVSGELVAVGGEDEENEITAAVYKYNPTTDSWNIISNMPTYQCDCLVAVLPTKEMMVVAGEINVEQNTDVVEIASIQYVAIAYRCTLYHYFFVCNSYTRIDMILYAVEHLSSIHPWNNYFKCLISAINFVHLFTFIWLGPTCIVISQSIGYHRTGEYLYITVDSDY